MSRPPGVRVLADVALSVAAALGAVGLVLLLLGSTLGVRPLLFRSGSMAPTIGTGDLALSRPVPASALHVGDVVSVVDAFGHRVTHRVVGIKGTGETRELRLRGDANRSADRVPYVVTSADRVVLVLHGLGWLIAALTGPVGTFGLGLYVALMLGLALRRGPSASTPRRRSHPHRRRPRGPAVGVALATAAAVVPAGAADATPWTDTVAVNGQPLTAATLAVPGSFTCAAALTGFTFRWAPVTPATGYLLTYTGGSAMVPAATTSYTVPGSALSLLGAGDASVHAVAAYSQVTWRSAESPSIHYTYALGALGALVGANC